MQIETQDVITQNSMSKLETYPNFALMDNILIHIERIFPHFGSKTLDLLNSFIFARFVLHIFKG